MILNGWKAIADYMGRGVRTVQRWELQLGLPVIRPRKHSRSPVCAKSEEIDAWMRKPRAESIAVGSQWAEIGSKLRTSLENHRTLRKEHRHLISDLAETRKQLRGKIRRAGNTHTRPAISIKLSLREALRIRRGKKRRKREAATPSRKRRTGATSSHQRATLLRLHTV